MPVYIISFKSLFLSCIYFIYFIIIIISNFFFKFFILFLTWYLLIMFIFLMLFFFFNLSLISLSVPFPSHWLMLYLCWWLPPSNLLFPVFIYALFTFSFPLLQSSYISSSTIEKKKYNKKRSFRNPCVFRYCISVLRIFCCYVCLISVCEIYCCRLMDTFRGD